MSAVSLSSLDEGVVLLTLDQPGSRVNIATPALLDDIRTALDSIGSRSDLRGVLIASGKPGIFLAGADLKLFADAATNPAPALEYIARGLAVLGALETLSCPTAALVDGACLGGGLEFALACDFRLTGTHPRCALGLPEVTLGLIPGWGGTQRLPRIIGVGPALDMMIAGQSISAERALALKLVVQSVPSETLIETGRRDLVASFVSGQWQAVRERKRQPVLLSADELDQLVEAKEHELIPAVPPPRLPAARAILSAVREGARRPLADGLAIETTAFAGRVTSSEALELIGAFFAARKQAPA